MAYTDRYDAAFGIYISRFLRNNVHTNIRGKVVGVNYGVPSVDVQPMAFTEFPAGTTDRYPVIYDVPILLPSGAGGKARLTMPIKAGDVVGLSFSERNEGDNTDQNTHQLFAGWAVTQIFTEGNAKAIDPENVVLENDKSIVTLKPNGDTSLKNPRVSVEALADGNVKINNGPGSFAMDPSGMVTVNGAKITPAGRIITADGVDLDDFFAYFKRHTHFYTWTDGSGSNNTNAPNT
nr:MAG TPA: baseplate protein [Caudoviricetes sp.]